MTLIRRIALFCFGIVPCTITAFAQPSSTAPAKLVVKNAFIMTMASGRREPIRGYLVVGEDGRLVAVAAGEPPAGLNAKDTLDADGHWVLPGFISAHSHLWQSAFRGMAADKTLPGWIQALYTDTASKAKPEDFYWFTLDGCLDHLQHGVTGAYNFNYGGAASYGQSGVHAALNSFDQNEFHAEEDSGIRFVHGIQVGRATALDAKPFFGVAEARPPLQAFLDWSQAQPKSPAQTASFLSVMINGGTAFNDTYQQAVMEKTLMDEFHLGNETHYLEPPETQWVEQSKFRWFMDSGLLSKQLIFGHFIHTNPFILAESAKAGASMSWNPLSNGRLASGVADIPAYLKAGIRVGMGVDGEASADLADPFENMRTGLYAIRDKYEDATIMSPYDVLRLQTMGSADVLGVADKLGSLEAGKLADFLVVDPSRFGPIFDPYASLVFIADERDLERVYVGGELMVLNGKVLKTDAIKVKGEVNKRVAAIR
jgi:cytosine/adenosine deaminase-related metal-dependent hydrolase